MSWEKDCVYVKGQNPFDNGSLKNKIGRLDCNLTDLCKSESLQKQNKKIRQQVRTHLVHIAGQAQQHGEQPLVQFVHRRQARLPFDHLGALADHVDHQAVEQLAGGNLHRAQGRNPPRYSIGHIKYPTNVQNRGLYTLVCLSLVDRASSLMRGRKGSR